MLSSSEISEAVNTACWGYESQTNGEIKLLTGPFKSPEHHLIAQYKAITDTADILDDLTFQIAQEFTTALLQSHHDHPTVKAIHLMATCSERELTVEECVFLIENDPAHRVYGLDLCGYAADNLIDLGKTDLAIDALKKSYLRENSLGIVQLQRLLDQFSAAATPEQKLLVPPPSVNALLTFTNFARANRITIPDYDVIEDRQVQIRTIYAESRAPA